MRIIGVYLDYPFVRASLIITGRRGIEVLALKSAPLHAPADVKQLYMKNFTGRIASGLSARDFLIRSLELKTVTGKHVEQAIAFQAEATSHFNPGEIITVPLLGGKKDKAVEALLITASKEALKHHLAELAKLGIDPDAVSIVPSALCHFARWKFPNIADAFILNLGSHETTCVWMENGRLKRAHAIAVGAETLIAALFEDRKKVLLRKEIEGAAKQIDLLLLKPGLNPHLTTALADLRREIGKIFYSFAREEKKPVIITGRTDAFIHLKEFLVEESENSMTLEERAFAVPIGLALEQNDPNSLQLRRAEFFPQRNWGRMGIYASALLAVSFALSIFLFVFALWSSHCKKKEMIDSFQLAGKGSVEQRIDNWIASIETHNKEYPYILQVPKVAEVLSWLSTHPLLERLRKEDDPIDLREVRYELVKFPKIESLQEPYLAKVEIEFRFKNAMNARKFHEALREGDSHVDAKREITWESLSDGYRTSFFLKNRSPYVL